MQNILSNSNLNQKKSYREHYLENWRNKCRNTVHINNRNVSMLYFLGESTLVPQSHRWEVGLRQKEKNKYCILAHICEI